MTGTHLLGPDSSSTSPPPTCSPSGPKHYLHGASCRQVAHVIEGSHLCLSLFFEVQLLTFDLDISSTWNQKEMGRYGWQKNTPTSRARRLAKDWAVPRRETGKT